LEVSSREQYCMYAAPASKSFPRRLRTDEPTSIVRSAPNNALNGTAVFVRKPKPPADRDGIITSAVVFLY